MNHHDLTQNKIERKECDQHYPAICPYYKREDYRGTIYCECARLRFRTSNLAARSSIAFVRIRRATVSVPLRLRWMVIMKGGMLNDQEKGIL